MSSITVLIHRRHAWAVVADSRSVKCCGFANSSTDVYEVPISLIILLSVVLGRMAASAFAGSGE